ncbi:MAG: O-antigen ligase family protein [Chloroflexota bacterium]|nr:O-antigen ligase family protein [Chloroflexota bacterium]
MKQAALPQRSFPHLSTWLLPALWLVIAVLVGIISAQTPLWVVGALIAGAALAATALITPTALLGALLILAPLRTLYATEAPRLAYPNIPLDIGQWLLIALIGVWAIQRLLRLRHPSSASISRLHLKRLIRMLLPLIAFIATAALSAFNAYSLSAWLSETLKFVQMLIIAVIVIDLLHTTPRDTFVALLVLAGLANAVIGIYQYYGGSGALHLLINERHFRAFGTFGQPNPFGGFMGLTLPLALAAMLAALWSQFQHWRARRSILELVTTPACTRLIFFAVASATIAIALYMSFSRGAWLGVAVAVGVMVFALPRRLGHSLLLAAVALLVAGAVIASGRLPAGIAARLSTVTEDVFNVRDVRGVDINPENYAVIERLAHWQAAVNMATHYPWTGVGLGNYEIAYEDFRLINWKFPLGHAHNYYLNVLAETGIIGLVFYATFIVSILFLAWRTRRHPDPSSRLIAIGILGVWVYLCVHSLTDNLYVNNLFIHLSVTIGLLVALNRELPARVLSVR